MVQMKGVSSRRPPIASIQSADTHSRWEQDLMAAFLVIMYTSDAGRGTGKTRKKRYCSGGANARRTRWWSVG